ncbi:MAG TPA: ABC transporter substrate-binding protein [Chloroflexota bacterium]|nr:ABC transporter substrate-binding protein [Chloroflexota bacterium]
MTPRARLARYRVAAVAALVVLIIGVAGATYLIRGRAKIGPDGSLERVTKRGTLIVGLDPSYAPFEVVNGQGQLDGYDVELSRELARRLGVKAQFVTVDFGSLFDTLTVDKVDTIVGGVSPFPEYAKTTTYSDPYFDAGQILVIQPAAPGSLLGIESGSDADLAQDELRKALPSYTFQQFDDQDQMRQQLADKKLRAAIVDAVTGTEWSRQIPGLQLRPARLTNTPFVYAFRRNDNLLRVTVDKALAAMARDGFIAQLNEKWLK